MRSLVLVAACCLAIGCARQSNIVGTWSSGLGGALTTYHFHPDGKFELETLFAGYRARVSGAYHTDGGKLDLDPQQSTVDGAGPDAEQIKSQTMQPSRVTMKFNSPDSFQLGLETPPLMLNRLSKEP